MSTLVPRKILSARPLKKGGLLSGGLSYLRKLALAYLFGLATNARGFLEDKPRIRLLGPFLGLDLRLHYSDPSSWLSSYERLVQNPVGKAYLGPLDSNDFLGLIIFGAPYSTRDSSPFYSGSGGWAYLRSQNLIWGSLHSKRSPR